MGYYFYTPIFSSLVLCLLFYSVQIGFHRPLSLDWKSLTLWCSHASVSLQDLCKVQPCHSVRDCSWISYLRCLAWLSIILLFRSIQYSEQASLRVQRYRHLHIRLVAYYGPLDLWLFSCSLPAGHSHSDWFNSHRQVRNLCLSLAVNDLLSIYQLLIDQRFPWPAKSESFRLPGITLFWNAN